MSLHNAHKTLRHHATRLRKHKAFHPCQGITQLGLIAMHLERATWAETCLLGGAVALIAVTLFAEIEGEVADFD